MDQPKPREKRNERTRRRMSLNFTTGNYAMLEALAALEHCTIHEAIRRSMLTRWRMHTALHPELAYPDMDPAKLPPPAHLALIDDATKEITLLEVF